VNVPPTSTPSSTCALASVTAGDSNRAQPAPPGLAAYRAAQAARVVSSRRRAGARSSVSARCWCEGQ
jgi:hypothetical protein